MNIVVTGGAGFIGSHLVSRLLQMGHSVWNVDNFSSGRREIIDELNQSKKHIFIEDDISNPMSVQKIIDGCDVVFHLAALLGVENTVRNPLDVIEANLNGTRNVLEAAFRGKKKVVFASTSEVYGKNPSVPFQEDTSLRVLGPTSVHRWCYATVKALDEHICYAYADKGLPVTIVRYFNAYGPRQSTYYGGVVAKFVENALQNRPLLIHGDGQQMRCFTYVTDSVQGTILAMDERANGRAYNIGRDIPVSVEELAKLIKELANSSSELVYVPYEQIYKKGFEDMKVRIPDLARAGAELGYQPLVGLREGLLRTIGWYRDQS